MPKFTTLLCHTTRKSTCTENTPRWHLLWWLLGGAAAVLVCVIPLSLARLAGYEINLSASMPIGIYELTEDRLGVGQIVAVCLPAAITRIGREHGYLRAGPCVSGDQAVIKPIAGMAGDTIEIQPTGVRINGTAIPNSAVRERDGAGRPLAHVPWGVITLQHGELWLMSTQHPNSWDSRYYGPVQVADVMVAVRPVLVATRAGGNK